MINQAASLLQMDSLMGRCADFLEEQLDVDNCLEIKDFANYQVGCEKLRLAAERFAGKAFDKVLIYFLGNFVFSVTF